MVLTVTDPVRWIWEGKLFPCMQQVVFPVFEKKKKKAVVNRSLAECLITIAVVM